VTTKLESNGSRRRDRAHRRAWPLEAYFVILLGLFMLAGAGSLLAVRVVGDAEGRDGARTDAAFAAKTASKQLNDALVVMQATVRGLAANPSIGRVFDNPALCSLNYSVTGAFSSGHVDVVRTDGSLVCSSMKPAPSTTYENLSWFGAATGTPESGEIASDPANGSPAAIFSAPVPGRGLIVLFADLRPLGPALGSGFGGDHPLELLITSKDGRTVVARSINPDRWVGASLAGTPFNGSETGTDVDRTQRLYARSDIALVGWRLYSGADENAALAGEVDLQVRILAVVLFGFAVAAVAIAVIYVRVARPISRLSAAVRSQHEASRSHIPTAGPTQVQSLAVELTDLLGSVDRELAQRKQAESDARQAETSYRALFASHPQAMMVADPTTLGFIEVNEAAMAL
jgi:hypothetical protein